MKRMPSENSGSLDMLLDTMCNTFGGVSFIALMVAILSLSLPGARQEEEDSSIREIETMEIKRLEREEMDLKKAVEESKRLLDALEAEMAGKDSLEDCIRGISSNNNAIAEIKAEIARENAKGKKLESYKEYNSKERERLKRLLAEMEEKLENPKGLKKRIARTPHEHEMRGYRPVDVWLRNGNLYLKNDKTQCVCREFVQNGTQHWEYSTVPFSGHAVDDNFFHSGEYRFIIDLVREMRYLRIFSDSESFNELCKLRDDLIRRQKKYNWYICDTDKLVFVEGIDEVVQ